MKHAVLMLLYNQVEAQLALSKECLDSILLQDIGPLEILLVNNGSTQPTVDWLDSLPKGYPNGTVIQVVHFAVNASPVAQANQWYSYLFNQRGYNKVLCVANDVILPSNFYRLLNGWPRGMVTASMNPQRDFTRFETAKATSENTPMAVGIVRRWFYDALVEAYGDFTDEHYFLYASDCDTALRMAACGLRGVQLDVQYFHHGSAHWRLLPPAEGSKETAKADADRAYFKAKHGFAVDSLEYGQVANDPNFRAEAKQ